MTQPTAAPAAPSKIETEIRRRVEIAEAGERQAAEQKRQHEDHFAREDRIRAEREKALRDHAERVPEWVWRIRGDVSDEAWALFVLWPEDAAGYPRDLGKAERDKLVDERAEKMGPAAVESVARAGLSIGGAIIDERKKLQRKFIAALDAKEEEHNRKHPAARPEWTWPGRQSHAQDIARIGRGILNSEAAARAEETARAAAAEAAAQARAAAAEAARLAVAAELNTIDEARKALASGTPPADGWTGLARRLGLSTNGDGR